MHASRNHRKSQVLRQSSSRSNTPVAMTLRLGYPLCSLFFLVIIMADVARSLSSMKSWPSPPASPRPQPQPQPQPQPTKAVASSQRNDVPLGRSRRQAVQDLLLSIGGSVSAAAAAAAPIGTIIASRRPSWAIEMPTDDYTTTATTTTTIPNYPSSSSFSSSISYEEPTHPFVYSPDWTGTKLPLLTLEEAVQPEHYHQHQKQQQQQQQQQSKFNMMESDSSSGIIDNTSSTWQMGRWPDPLLRRPATEVDPRWFGTSTLQKACQLLQQTAQAEGAVGLAAQQCGVDARIVYVEQPFPQVLINPRIVRRSPEIQGRIWKERCLVLPPTFNATVVRDDWIEVEYDSSWQQQDSRRQRQRQRRLADRPKTMRLYGEASRCLQHELDHDRGILVTDHVGLDELESDIMRAIERPGHDERMQRAYERG